MVSRSVARGGELSTFYRARASLGSQWYLPTIPTGVKRVYLEGYNWKPEGVKYIVPMNYIVPIGRRRTQLEPKGRRFTHTPKINRSGHEIKGRSKRQVRADQLEYNKQHNDTHTTTHNATIHNATINHLLNSDIYI